MKVSKNAGNNVKKAMATLYTQAKLAKKLGISNSFMWKLLNGKAKWELSLGMTVAHLFGYTVEEMFGSNELPNGSSKVT